jgi:hypothetical protein
MTDREQFEAWVKSRGGDCMKKGTPGEPMYLSSMTREWLAAWQAARAAPEHPAERVLLTRNTLRDESAWRESRLPSPPESLQRYGREYAWATIERIE